MNLIFPNAVRINRGTVLLKELVDLATKKEVTDIVDTLSSDVSQYTNSYISYKSENNNDIDALNIKNEES